MPPNVEQIAKSTMEISWQPWIIHTQEEKDQYDRELARALAAQCTARPESETDKMKADIKALSRELEALRYEINLSTLSFLVILLAFCVALILKFTGVI